MWKVGDIAPVSVLGVDGYPYGFNLTTEDGKPLVSFGYRLMARRDPVGIRLLTRRGKDSSRFPLIVEAVNHLRVHSCLIDGEVVCCVDLIELVWHVGISSLRAISTFSGSADPTSRCVVLARVFATFRLTAPTPSAGHSSKHTRQRVSHSAHLPSADRFHAVTAYWSRPISTALHA